MRTLGSGALALLLTVALSSPAAADETGAQLAQLLDKTAGSIVTVKVVVKTEIAMMGQSEESRLDLKGVVVDASGLVMISNADISADRMASMLGGMGGGGGMDPGIKITPSDFKVVFGNEEKEYEGFLVAKDTELDLAFVAVKDLGDRKLTGISFETDAKPQVGQQVVGISRTPKGFDYAPYFATGRVSGKIKKPRKAWMVDGNISTYGLPVFTMEGKVLGVLITLTPPTTDEAGGGLSGLMRMFRGGGGGSDGTFLLPAKSVKRLVTQSVEKAKELEAMSAEDAAEKDAGGEKSDG
ncbi:MAG: serine protease [Planctomycetota bacterium]